MLTGAGSRCLALPLSAQPTLRLNTQSLSQSGYGGGNSYYMRGKRGRDGASAPVVSLYRSVALLFCPSSCMHCSVPCSAHFRCGLERPPDCAHALEPSRISLGALMDNLAQGSRNLVGRALSEHLLECLPRGWPSSQTMRPPRSADPGATAGTPHNGQDRPINHACCCASRRRFADDAMSVSASASRAAQNNPETHQAGGAHATRLPPPLSTHALFHR